MWSVVRALSRYTCHSPVAVVVIVVVVVVDVDVVVVCTVAFACQRRLT